MENEEEKLSNVAQTTPPQTVSQAATEASVESEAPPLLPTSLPPLLPTSLPPPIPTTLSAFPQKSREQSPVDIEKTILNLLSEKSNMEEKVKIDDKRIEEEKKKKPVVPTAELLQMILAEGK